MSLSLSLNSIKRNMREIKPSFKDKLHSLLHHQKVGLLIFKFNQKWQLTRVDLTLYMKYRSTIKQWIQIKTFKAILSRWLDLN
jgi:hypothetical protein